MHEKLVSYLLGDLDEAERLDVEARLAKEPQLRQELERLRDCLELYPDDHGKCAESKVAHSSVAKYSPSNEPPDDLADRTADCVSQLALALVHGSPQENSDCAATGRCSFSLVDAMVTVGVVFAVGMMLLPALRESREASRRTACQENMQFISKGLQLYAYEHNGYFPLIRRGENAGMFTVYLTDGGYLDREELAQRVVCSASPEASQVASRTLVVRVPTRTEVRSLNGDALESLRRLMSLNYAYRLGYHQNERYQPIHNKSNTRSPLLSDAPTLVDGAWRSINHGGCGQNVLFQDGSVRYQLDCRIPVLEDHLFVNREGRAEVPRQWNDAVLVRSEITPEILPAASKRSAPAIHLLHNRSH